MTRYHVSLTVADVCKVHGKSFMLHVCGITKWCITVKVISLWATRALSIYVPIFLLWLYGRVLCRLQKVSSFFRCSDTRVHFRSIFLISTSCFKESIGQNNFNWSSSFLYQTQDIRQIMCLSSPIFLLTMATTWTSQLLVQNWSKTPLSARSSVSRRIHVCPSTWQIWMITLTICYVNCFHLTITPIQTSSSPTIFGITTVLR